MMTPHIVLALLSSLTATDILNRCIAYHDPDGRWGRGTFAITDVATRPGGKGSRKVLRFDNARGRFEMESSVDSHALKIVVQKDEVVVRSLDGRAELSDAELDRFKLRAAQVLAQRNFHLYLYGLPMKLKDPGTRLDPKVREVDFQGRPVYELRVTYDKSVGSDTWNFYVDRKTFALVGHLVHRDQSAGDDEYAVLSEEVSGQGLRLPRVRKWHKSQGSEWFITHTIQSIAAP
jgi:hypothetical protein